MMMTFGANRCLTIKTKKEMKKNLFMVAAVALMALVSCNKEEINNGGVEATQPQEPSVVVEFTASLGEDTKTTLDFANKKTLWVETDAISINGQKFTIKEIQEDGKAIFVNAGTLPEDFAAPFTAIYPFGSDGKVPAAQKAVAGNFDPEAVIETANSENYTLSFTNVTSLLKFQVPAACKSVSISATENLAEGANTVTISGDMVAGTDYYVAVLPGDKTNFVVRIDGYLSKNAASVTINPSTIANMKTLPAAVDAKWRLKGAFDWTNGKVFYKDLNDYIVVKNVTFDSTTEFKAHNQDGKDEWCRVAANVALGNQWYKIGQYDGGNSRIIKGTYDVYVDPVGYNIYFITAGENLTAAIPKTQTVTVYLNSTNYNSLWCWNKDNSSENFTGGSWPGQNSTTNEVINGKTYRKWVLKSCNIGVYTNMIFSKNGNSQTGEDGDTGLLMGETMFVKLDNGKTRFNNDI